MKSPGNLHATGLVLGDFGLLIMGPSGSGKTALALSLVERAKKSGRHGALIADDQVLPENCGGALLVHAPASIAGLAEIRGLGPKAMAHLGSARIDGVLVLVPPETAPRLDDDRLCTISGVTLPCLHLAAKSGAAAVIAAESWISGLAAAG